MALGFNKNSIPQTKTIALKAFSHTAEYDAMITGYFRKRYLPFEHNLMIHCDSHPDMFFPIFDLHLAYDKEELLQQLSIENWISPQCLWVVR
jgi:hypothetical protein